jgi:hypothetical protein
VPLAVNLIASNQIQLLARALRHPRSAWTQDGNIHASNGNLINRSPNTQQKKRAVALPLLRRKSQSKRESALAMKPAF